MTTVLDSGFNYITLFCTLPYANECASSNVIITSDVSVLCVLHSQYLVVRNQAVYDNK